MTSKIYVALDLQPTVVIDKHSPLHVTLTPPVKIENAALWHLQDNLAEKVKGFGAITITGAGIDYFGPNSEPVKVRKIWRTDVLTSLHSIAINEVLAVAPDVDTTYIGERWEPHATYKGEFGLDDGEEMMLNEVTILQKIADVWDRAAIVSLLD